MASDPNRHPIPRASNLSHQKCKWTSPSCSSSSSTARHLIPPASNLSHRKVKQNSSSSSSSSTATCPPAAPASNVSRRKEQTSSFSTSSCPPAPPPPASNLSHCKVKRSSSSTVIRPPAAPASNPSHRKGKQTYSSSSTATCPPAPPPSSSFVDHPEIKYDVFISFRGPDVRCTFLSHLLKELLLKKIDYFVDDQNLRPGDQISSTLLDAIKKSEISLVLFSEDYASSKWCLEELDQIIQCMENQKQIILPVFYKVNPSTVRHQKEKFKEAFHKLGERYDDDKLRKWKAALKRASDISGFDSSKYNNEAILIKAIVERVSEELRKTANQIDLKGFVGIQKHIQILETLLDPGSEDILVIGIWGMGGIGKTTIVEVLYNRFCDKYDGSLLLCVKEELDKGRNIRDLKTNLLSKLLGEVVTNVTLNGIPQYIERRLRRQKVLVVLDDVNELSQLEILIGGHLGFRIGSRIIMTSRDRQVFSKKCDEIYQVEGLNSKDSLKLFEKCFEKSSIKKQELCELSKMVVNYAKGVPLVIKVLAGYLSGIESKLEWESKMKKLNYIPDPKIQQVLELSYNGLDDDEHKDIFLYLACFFRYESKDQIIKLLDACDYHVIDGLRALQDKTLITIAEGGSVCMHDLIRDMGREIVRKRSPKDLGQRSHLWNVGDICKVFKDQLGTQTIESIRLNSLELAKDLQLGSQAFAGMNNIRLLQFDANWEQKDKYSVNPPKEGFESLPKELRFFNWSCYPLESFPLRCPCMNNLVELHFEFSDLKKLWHGVKEFSSLKFINLFSSSELIELPNLSGAPNLKDVNLDFCYSLFYVPLWPRDAWESDEDGHWHLLSTSAYVLPSLQHLDLTCCDRISFGLPDNIDCYLPSLHKLSLQGTKFKALPKGITHLEKLATLDVRDCMWLEYIPELPPSIESFHADGCTSLKTVKFSLNSMHLPHKKNGLSIGLESCIQLSEETLENVALHYKTSTQRIISAGRENSNALLYFSGSKVPKCFQTCYARHESVSVPLNLPLQSEATGFIFYFLIRDMSYWFKLRIKCHIELCNGAKVEFICGSTDLPITNGSGDLKADTVFLWYKGSLSLKIVEELSRINASATTDNSLTKVWFELLGDEYCLRQVKEWGVYSVISFEP